MVDPDPPPLHRRVDFLVHDIARRHGRRFDRAAAGRVGLSRAQLRVAAALDDAAAPEGVTQCALAARLGLTEMAVATLCARMEAAGWVRRVPSSVDRRARLVCLTAAARRELAGAVQVADALAEDLLADLDADARGLLLRLLQRLHGRLVDADEPAAPPLPAPPGPVARRRRSSSPPTDRR